MVDSVWILRGCVIVHWCLVILCMNATRSHCTLEIEANNPLRNKQAMSALCSGLLQLQGFRTHPEMYLPYSGNVW